MTGTARFLFAFSALLLPALVSCSGCSSQPEDHSIVHREIPEGLHDPDTPRFAKIDTQLVLQRGIKRMLYYAGKKGQKMTFFLSNPGLKSIMLYEWQKAEPDNIRISVSPVEKEQWRQVWPEKKASTESGQLVPRQPVLLAPGNRLNVAVPLTFLETYPLKAGLEERLKVKAELNLHSVQAQPLVYEIVIRSGQRTRIREIIIAD